MLSEMQWYQMPLSGGWQYFGTALIFVRCVFPVALLLSRSLKRHGRRLILIALLILFMRMVELFWLTAPNFYKGAESGFATFHLVDAAMYIVCPIAIGGIWLFM